MPISLLRPSTIMVLIATTACMIALSCSPRSSASRSREGTPLPAAALAIVREAEAGTFPRLDSLLIETDGNLRVELYRNGNTAQTARPVYSVTKTVTALLLGIAIDEGLIPGPEALLADLLPEAGASLDDPLKRGIRLEHLLTMTAGLGWDEDSTDYSDPSNPVRRLLAADDPIDVILARPMSDPPGARFVYNSGLSILISIIIERAAGIPFDEWARERLFIPMGISGWAWERLAGRANGGWGLSLKPADLVKLGRLVLNRGSWNGKILVPPEYVDAMTSVRSRPDGRLGYGYQIWLRPGKASSVYDPGALIIPVFVGWGGQYAYILREKKTIIVSTASDFGASAPGISPSIGALIDALTGS